MIVGVGTDIVAIARIEESVERNSRFLDKIFTQGERQYFAQKNGKMQTLAGIFAAKEACVKALGTGFLGGITAQDVEITHTELGAPQIILHKNAKKRAKSLGINSVQVSISHCKTYAVAFVVAQKTTA